MHSNGRYSWITHSADWQGLCRLQCALTQQSFHLIADQLADGHIVAADEETRVRFGAFVQPDPRTLIEAAAIAAKGRTEYRNGLSLNRPRQVPPEIGTSSGHMTSFLFGLQLMNGEMPMYRGWVDDVQLRLSSPPGWGAAPDNVRKHVLIDLGDFGDLPPFVPKNPKDDLGRIGRLSLGFVQARELCAVIQKTIVDGNTRRLDSGGTVVEGGPYESSLDARDKANKKPESKK